MVKTIPVLPLRDIVVFPNMVAPLFVGREQSVNALNHVMAGDKKIFLLSVRSEPTRIFFFYPELVIISGWLILTDNSSNLFIQMASYIILSVCILYIIITTKYLNFLGEAYRYIEYALAGIGPILLSLMLFDISGSYNFFKDL